MDEREPEYEFFKVGEGEDLKCRVYDADGNEIPLRVQSTVIMIQ